MQRIVCALGLMLLTTTAHADDKAPAKLDLVAGQWKITRLLSLGSSHKLTRPAPTTECLSADRLIPAAEIGWPTGATCTSEKTVTGSKVDWSFTCKVDASTTVTGKGTLTYAGKKMSGTINVTKETNTGSEMSGQRGLLKITGAYSKACPAAT